MKWLFVLLLVFCSCTSQQHLRIAKKHIIKAKQIEMQMVVPISDSTVVVLNNVEQKTKKVEHDKRTHAILVGLGIAFGFFIRAIIIP